MGITGLTVTPDVAAAVNLPANQGGVLIEQVVDASPAADAGLRGSTQPATAGGQQIMIGGDIIIGFDGQPVNSVQDLTDYLSVSQAGDSVLLTVVRNGQVGDVQVVLGEQPEVSA